MSGSEAESDFDSDFDDFNEAVVHTTTTEVEEGTTFTEDTLSNPQLFDKRLDTLLSTLFPISANQNESRGVSRGASPDLLSDRSQQVFGQLSRLPYLLPPNWTKLKIRYNLLLRLGIPINLDELTSDGTSSSSSHNLQVDTAIIRGRRPSGSSHLDGGTHIDWDGFELPPIEAIPVEEVELIKTTTSEVLSNIELGMLNHSSEKFLLDSDMAVVDEKLAQFQHFYNQLLKLASVWMGEIASCQGEFETYETVIQSVIGYSQKLKREEILHKLQRQ
ncbi:uncharacterized protein KQ657_002777 [Scheffersomyces spartinae]|uniref:Uncharacterized protein n=1 Tax=Scheffersomyces spartinae TaxID=45513 RepID=A0A9P7V5L3_9ASCO|nr:uncharacterized protein KQ657_002777 [Scheffersomyces spartinae]KAG7191812.1 hypothetical protein KQ657_002777 [Scheffersomyces spartinae]